MYVGGRGGTFGQYIEGGGEGGGGRGQKISVKRAAAGDRDPHSWPL